MEFSYEFGMIIWRWTAEKEHEMKDLENRAVFVQRAHYDELKAMIGIWMIWRAYQRGEVLRTSSIEESLMNSWTLTLRMNKWVSMWCDRWKGIRLRNSSIGGVKLDIIEIAIIIHGCFGITTIWTFLLSMIPYLWFGNGSVELR